MEFRADVGYRRSAVDLRTYCACDERLGALPTAFCAENAKKPLRVADCSLSLYAMFVGYRAESRAVAVGGRAKSALDPA